MPFGYITVINYCISCFTRFSYFSFLLFLFHAQLCTAYNSGIILAKIGAYIILKIIPAYKAQAYLQTRDLLTFEYNGDDIIT